MEGRDLITRLPGSTDYRQGTVNNFGPGTAMELAERKEGTILRKDDVFQYDISECNLQPSILLLIQTLLRCLQKGMKLGTKNSSLLKCISNSFES